MTVLSPQDLLAFVGIICLILITIFLCWALFEVAKLVKQANEMVSETRRKVSRIEELVSHIGEKIGASAQYLALIAEGGRQILSFFQKKSEPESEPEPTPKNGKKKTKDTLSEMP